MSRILSHGAMIAMVLILVQQSLYLPSIAFIVPSQSSLECFKGTSNLYSKPLNNNYSYNQHHHAIHSNNFNHKKDFDYDEFYTFVTSKNRASRAKPLNFSNDNYSNSENNPKKNDNKEFDYDDFYSFLTSSHNNKKNKNKNARQNSPKPLYLGNQKYNHSSSSSNNINEDNLDNLNTHKKTNTNLNHHRNDQFDYDDFYSFLTNQNKKGRSNTNKKDAFNSPPSILRSVRDDTQQGDSLDKDYSKLKESESKSKGNNVDDFYSFIQSQSSQNKKISPKDRVKRMLGGGSGTGSNSDVMDNEENDDRSSKTLIQPISLSGRNLNQDNSETKSNTAVRTNFQSLFQGMPSISDIIGSSGDSKDDGKDTTQRRSSLNQMSDDEIWNEGINMDSTSRSKFQEEQSRINNPLSNEDMEKINQHYSSLKLDMQNKLNELRRNDRDSVPDNAEMILDQVIQEQRMISIRELSQQRSMEYLTNYENGLKEKLQSRNEKDGPGDDAIVQEIMSEAQKDYDYKESQGKKYQEFAQYEQSKRKEMEKREINEIQSSPDFDETQIKIMQDFLQRRQQMSEEAGFDEEDLFLTDNIEDGIEELQASMDQKRREKDSTKPESLKEWQMYREIVTRINREIEDSEEDENSEMINNQLESWKELQRKEQELRDKFGLSVKVQMPFAWSDKPDYDESIANKKASISTDPSQIESAYSTLDDLAVQVLQDLISKTMDPIRRGKLQRELEELKVDIEQRQKTLSKKQKKSSQQEAKKRVEPVNLSSIFKQSTKRDVDETKMPSPPKNIVGVEEKKTSPPAIRPNTPFFTASNDIVEPAVRPNTPFFTASNDDREEVTNDIPRKGDTTSVFLGSLEEQKFRNMLKRSGVRSVDEEAKMKKKYEEYLEAEKRMRDQSGLSEQQKSEAKTKTKYELNDVIKSDGDIDADKILSTIGPRPSRTKKDSSSSFTPDVKITKEPQQINTSVDELDENDDDFDEDDDNDTDVAVEEDEDDDDDLFDDEAFLERERQVKEFERKYVKGSKEISIAEALGRDYFGPDDYNDYEYSTDTFSSFEKQKANLLEYSVLTVTDLNSLIDYKVSSVETGVSPYLAKVNKPLTEFGAIFRLEGALVDVTGLHQVTWKKIAEQYGLKIPTLEDVKLASVSNEEYSVRKLFYWTDDVVTCKKLKQRFRDVSNEIFEKWQSDNPMEVKDYSDDSKFAESRNNAPPIVSPIEDVKNERIIDPSGPSEEEVMIMQLKAWEQAALKAGKTPPTAAALEIAAFVSPEKAIASIFNWTKSENEIKMIVSSYRESLKELSRKWVGKMKPRSIQPNTKSTVPVTSSQQNDIKKYTGPTEGDVLKMHVEAWRKATEGTTFPLPNIDEVKAAAFIGPEEAVGSLFKWTSNKEETQHIVTKFRNELKTLSREWVSKMQKNSILSYSKTNQKLEETLPLFLSKDGIVEFMKMLHDTKVPCVVISNLNKNQSDEILQRCGLSEFFSVDMRITSDDQYGDEMQQMLGGALRAERRPDHCFVIGASPQTATIAHDIEMKMIGIVSPYPYYELTNADLTSRYFDTINAVNIRGLFSDKEPDEPVQELQLEGPELKRKRLIQTMFWEEGDR